MHSCAAPTDYQRSSQAFSPRIAHESQLNHAAEQQKPYLGLVPPLYKGGNRLPGHLFLRRLKDVFGRNGARRHRTMTVHRNLKENLKPCVKWLRDNPRYAGVYGRMSMAFFRGSVARGETPRASWYDMLKVLQQEGFISYADDGIRTYVDFADWDEPVAHAHYERTKAQATRQKAARTRFLRAEDALERDAFFLDVDAELRTAPPSIMPLSLPFEPEFEHSGFKSNQLRPTSPLATKSVELAPVLAARPSPVFKQDLKTQHPTPAPKAARPPEPERAPEPAQAAEPVLDVGLPERKLGKEGSVAKDYFLTLVAKLPPADPEPAPANKASPRRMPPVVPACFDFTEVRRRAAAEALAERNSAGLTASTLSVINDTFNLKLSWTKLRHTALAYEHLRDAALYAKLTEDSVTQGWRSPEGIVIHSAKQRAKGVWGGLKSQKSRR